MNNVTVDARPRKKLGKLEQIARDIQHAINEIENGVGSLESAVSELPEATADVTANMLLEDIGLSSKTSYSLLDIERLKIAVKWALEGEA